MPFEVRFQAAAVRYTSVRSGPGGGWRTDGHGRHPQSAARSCPLSGFLPFDLLFFRMLDGAPLARITPTGRRQALDTRRFRLALCVVYGLQCPDRIDKQ
jgi:hypothetical protein